MFDKTKNFIEKSISYGVIYDLYPYIRVAEKRRPNMIYNIWKVFNGKQVTRTMWEKDRHVNVELKKFDAIY